MIEVIWGNAKSGIAWILIFLLMLKVICGYVTILGILGIISFQLTMKAIWSNFIVFGMLGIVNV